MTSQLRVLAVTVGLFCAATSFAQTAPPAAAPAAKAPMAAPATPATPATPAAKASAPMNAPAAAAAPAAAKTPAAPAEKTAAAAAGGGNGKVWVNTSSKTYHCAGSKHYGKTKAGEYMTEAAARAKGNHADHGKGCAK